jgi:shikimate dehydrogenase
VSRPATLTLSISGRTRVAGIIGSPVGHSLSPAMHNAAFAACGLDWCYVAFEVPAGGAGGALDAVRRLGLAGLSVTMPHKADVAALVDERSATVEALGAANTVVVAPDGRLRGESTDGEGLLDTLRLDHQIDPAGMVAVVLGAGGAARAVVRALAGAACREVVVVNRTASSGEAAAALAGGRGRAGDLDEVGRADLLVQATPLGMGEDGTMPVDPGRLRAGQIVADLVYHPLRTPLLLAAADRGCRTVDGLGMLVHQGARQLELWTGLEAPRDVMRNAAEAALAGS